MSSFALRGLAQAFRGAAEAASQRSIWTSSCLQNEVGQTFAAQQPAQYNHGQPQDEHLTLQTIERWESDQANSFSLVGNVLSSPTLRMDRNGRALLNLTVVRNRRRRTQTGYDDMPAEFYKFLVTGPLAHAVVREVRKGQKVLVNSVVLSSTTPGDPSQTTGPSKYPTYTYSFIARNVSLVQAPPRES